MINTYIYIGEKAFLIKVVGDGVGIGGGIGAEGGEVIILGGHVEPSSILRAGVGGGDVCKRKTVRY